MLPFRELSLYPRVRGLMCPNITCVGGEAVFCQRDLRLRLHLYIRVGDLRA